MTETNTFTDPYIRFRNTTPLSEEEQLELVKQAQAGNQQARSTLILTNSRLALTIANTFQMQTSDFDDLLQEAFLALNDAITRFDSKYRVPFHTYAAQTISLNVMQYLRKSVHIVYYTDSIKRKIRKYQQIMSEMEQKAVSYSRAEIMALCNIQDEFEYSVVENATKPILCLYHPVETDEDVLLTDMIEDIRQNTENTVMSHALSDHLIRIMQTCLSDRELFVVTNYYGLRQDCALSMPKLAERLQMHKSSVKRIHDRALQKLRANEELQDLAKAYHFLRETA